MGAEKGVLALAKTNPDLIQRLLMFLKNTGKSTLAKAGAIGKKGISVAADDVSDVAGVLSGMSGGLLDPSTNAGRLRLKNLLSRNKGRIASRAAIPAGILGGKALIDSGMYPDEEEYNNY